MERVLLFFLLMYTSSAQKGASVMKTLSSSIGDEVLLCQEKMKISETVIDDFMDFWDENKELQHHELGCALDCVFSNMEILTDDGRHVKTDNFKQFTVSIGADDTMSRKLVDLFELCKKATSKFTEKCIGSLEAAKCFRYGIFQLQWAPKKQKKHSRRTERRPGGQSVGRPAGRPAKRSESRANIGAAAKLSERAGKLFISQLIDMVKGPQRRFNKKSG